MLSHDFFPSLSLFKTDREKEKKTNLHLEMETICDFSCIIFHHPLRYLRKVAHQLCSYNSNLCYSLCVIAKEFCVWPYIPSPCPCRLRRHFLNLICAKQSCPIVLGSSNWLQLGSLLHAGSPLSCMTPRRVIIHLSCTLPYQQIQDATE